MSGLHLEGIKPKVLEPMDLDLAPGELIFAKLKQLLRSLACRSRDALWNATQTILDQVTPNDAENCYEHCGYTLRVD